MSNPLRPTISIVRISVPRDCTDSFWSPAPRSGSTRRRSCSTWTSAEVWSFWAVYRSRCPVSPVVWRPWRWPWKWNWRSISICWTCTPWQARNRIRISVTSSRRTSCRSRSTVKRSWRTTFASWRRPPAMWVTICSTSIWVPECIKANEALKVVHHPNKKNPFIRFPHVYWIKIRCPFEWSPFWPINGFGFHGPTYQLASEALCL